MRLCKKCNKESHKHLTKAEMAQIQKEQAAAAVSSRAAKEEQKAKDEEKKEAQEAAEGEGEGDSSGEEAPKEA
jgi:hypothetical protein